MKHNDLSLRQKIGQLFMVTIEGHYVDGEMINLLTQYHVGGIHLTNSNMDRSKQIYHLTNELQHFSNKALQLFIAVKHEIDAKGMTGVPSQQTLGTINNRLYTKQAADIAGKEMKAAGINMYLGPDFSLSKEATTTFSDTITHVAQHGRAMMEGYHKNEVLSVVGDFLDGYNHIPQNMPLYKTGIQPYVYAIEHGLEAVLTSNIKLAVPFLRNEMNFEGLILYNTSYHEDLIGEVMEAIEYGADMVSLNCDYKTQLHIMEEVFQAVKNAAIPEPTINRAINRIAAKKKGFEIDEPPAFNGDLFMDKQANLFMKKLESLQS